MSTGFLVELDGIFFWILKKKIWIGKSKCGSVL